MCILRSGSFNPGEKIETKYNNNYQVIIALITINLRNQGYWFSKGKGLIIIITIIIII